MRFNSAASILVLAGTCVTATAQPRFRITELGVPVGFIHSEAYGVNEAGQAVGCSRQFLAGGSVIQHAMLWDGPATIDLGVLGGGTRATAFRINNAGQIVGQSEASADGLHANVYGFIHDIALGSMTGLVTFSDGTGSPPFNSDAQSINDAGLVGGMAVCSVLPSLTNSMVLWPPSGGHECLPGGDINSNTFGLNSLGHAGGKFPTTGGYHAFYWDGVTVLDLSTFGGAIGHSEGRDINESDEVVGWAENTASSYSHAFLWSAGVMVDLDTRGPAVQTLSQALAINNLGQIVGSGNILGHEHWDAILWDGGVQHALTDLLPPGHGWDLLEARDISDSGYIVGIGTNPALERRGFLLTPICGDANLDGSVDLTDLAILLSHFGIPAGATLGDGDFDADGDVDLGDLTFLLSHFGMSCP